MIKTFSVYKEKLSSENFKLWMFYLSIISKISCLIKLNKHQFIENTQLSNSEIYMILNELISISSILEENKIFSISKNNFKFLEIQICLQIQLNLVEAIKNILKNKTVVKAFVLINSQNIITFMKRVIYLLFFDKKKIKTENSLLYGMIYFNCFFIIYYVITDEELLNNFFKPNINKFCDFDIEKFKEKLLIELNDFKNNINYSKISKFEEIVGEINKKLIF